MDVKAQERLSWLLIQYGQLFREGDDMRRPMAAKNVEVFIDAQLASLTSRLAAAEERAAQAEYIAAQVPQLRTRIQQLTTALAAADGEGKQLEEED